MSTQRRHFLLGSLAASAAVPLRAQEPQQIRVGFIGTGGRGTYLLKGTLALPGVKVMAVCDTKPDRLDNAATVAARDKPNTYSEWRRLIDRKDIDAIYIATPCDLHVEMALAALQAGKHIYCEKAVWTTRPQSRRATSRTPTPNGGVSSTARTSMLSTSPLPATCTSRWRWRRFRPASTSTARSRSA